MANGARIGHILRRNEKGVFYGVFRYWPGDMWEKRSPYRAYFTWGIIPSFLRLPDEKKRGQNPLPEINATIPGAVARYG
ncbi:MAG: hypothetical protein WCX22_01040 [Methanoregula sp.]